MKGYETFEHGADVGIRGCGETLEEAFSEVLKALTTLYVESIDFNEVFPASEREVEVSADTLDELLVFFVNKAISLVSLEDVLVIGFQGRIEEREGEYHLTGKFLVIPFDVERFGYGVEVKGATFTQAKVEKREEGWIIQCVVDV
jgi:SHS2 domain-containing protein